MLQDSLRSAVYKSLTKPLPISWENGNQTIRCGTNGRSKTSNSADVTSTIQGSGHQGCNELEEKAMMEARDKSELQLFQVARGARELTQMINSLSKAPNHDGRSKYITNDLLRGALDLQDSLDMLSMLQEASKSMSYLKWRPKFVEEEEDDVEETVDSQRFGFQERRLSVDGSSRNCVEGLKRMSQLKHKKKPEFMEDIGFEERIGSRRCGLQEPRLPVDGFTSRSSIKEIRRVIKDSLYQQSLLSFDDEKYSLNQSLRSSRSSRYEKIENFCERNEKISNSVPANPEPEKVKGLNLIAKLMGLEEVPSETLLPLKKIERKKSSILPKPSFDIGRPKARTLHFVENKSMNPSQKTLQEIIETMQFKGLLKRSHVDDFRNKSHCFDEAQMDRYTRRLSIDDDPPPIVVMKPLYLPHWERRANQKGLLSGKFSVKEQIHSAELIQEKKVFDDELVLPKTFQRKELKPTEKAKLDQPQKINSLSTVSRKPQIKMPLKTHKRVDDEKKTVLNGMKQEKKKDFKSKRDPFFSSKTTCTEKAKPNKRLSKPKSNVLPVQPVPNSSTGPVKEKQTAGAKPFGKSTAIKTDDKKWKDGKANNPPSEIKPLSKIRSMPGDGLRKEEEEKDKFCNKDAITSEQKILCESFPKTSHSEKSHQFAEAVTKLPNHKTAVNEGSGADDDLKHLLFSSQSFLTCAQKLFGIKSHQPIYYQRRGVEDDVMRNAKLYLDCGKELMALKGNHRELLTYSMLNTQMWAQAVVPFSLDKLVEEISNEIRIVTGYSKVDNSVASEDSIYMKLEKDLQCKGMLVNIMWDVGWVEWSCAEEIGELVGQVEEYIISLLIEDVTMDLIY